jgi:hypothetical protein
MRERDRELVNGVLNQYERFRPFTVPGRSSFLTVHRFRPFTVPGRSSFLTVHRFRPFTVPDRFMIVSERFLSDLKGS